MENTQDVWVLYGPVLTLNFLNADEQVPAAYSYRIGNWTAKLNQLRYFRATLTLKKKSKIMLL